MTSTGEVGCFALAMYTAPCTTTPPLASSRTTCGLSRDLTWACAQSPVRCPIKGDVIVQLHLELWFSTTSLSAQLPQILQPQLRTHISTSKRKHKLTPTQSTMSDALNPTGPAQPDLSDAYTAPGNPATKEPAEETQASAIASDSSATYAISLSPPPSRSY